VRRQHSGDRASRQTIGLGYVIDPVYGKMKILRIGEAGDGHRSFLVKGAGFGPDWRDESELSSVHLTQAGLKRAERIGQAHI